MLLGEEDSAGEAMGPQILINLPGDNSMDVRTDTLEFTSSYLILYGLPLTQDFAAVQALVVDIATRLRHPKGEYLEWLLVRIKASGLKQAYQSGKTIKKLHASPAGERSWTASYFRQLWELPQSSKAVNAYLA